MILWLGERQTSIKRNSASKNYACPKVICDENIKNIYSATPDIQLNPKAKNRALTDNLRVHIRAEGSLWKENLAKFYPRLTDRRCQSLIFIVCPDLSLPLLNLLCSSNPLLLVAEADQQKKSIKTFTLSYIFYIIICFYWLK